MMRGMGFAAASHRLSPVTGRQLVENVVEMPFHRSQADHQQIGNGLIGRPIGHEAQYL